ncbi:hypothetical protein Trydic_g446 [Trypoxylus dichotomus]
MNYELISIIKNGDIIRYMKSRRLQWLGHIMRMSDTQTPKRVLAWKPTGRKPRGRLRKRRLENAEKDLKTMGVKRWRKGRNGQIN